MKTVTHLKTELCVYRKDDDGVGPLIRRDGLDFVVPLGTTYEQIEKALAALVEGDES